MQASSVVRCIRSRDFWSSLFFGGIALCLWGGRTTSSSWWTSVAGMVTLFLCVVVLALWVRLLLWPARRKKVDWHIPLWVLVIPLGWAVWALLIETLGLWCSTVLFVGLIMLVHPQRKIYQVLWCALGISTVMTLFFVYGLDVSVPVWPMLLREALP